MTPSIDQLAQRGGSAFERWFNIARVIVVFVLGVAMIIFAVAKEGYNIPYVIAGLVLIGLVPIDQWLQRLPAQRKEGDDAQHPPR